MESVKNKQLGKYVDIRTDFGMKFYFGREENKVLLIGFLNSLFEGRKIIRDLHYTTIEHDGDQPEMRRTIFDLYCIGQDGEHFIVEMQQLHPDYFRDRAVFYTSRLINKQLPRGKKGNDYCLPEVYFIGILEFSLHESQAMPDDRSADQSADRPHFYDVALCDRNTHEVFYDKLGYKLISLPDFQKSPDELHTVMDQWLYLLKHLSKMEKLPNFLDKRIFGLIFDIGRIGNLTKEELMSYESSWKRKMDERSIHTSAVNAGLRQGREESQKEFVKNLILKFGFTDEQAAEAAGVSLDFAKEVQAQLDNKK